MRGEEIGEERKGGGDGSLHPGQRGIPFPSGGGLKYCDYEPFLGPLRLSGLSGLSGHRSYLLPDLGAHWIPLVELVETAVDRSAWASLLSGPRPPHTKPGPKQPNEDRKRSMNLL